MSDNISSCVRKILFLALGFIALLPLFVRPVSAAPGDLDTTFGTGGKVTTPIGSSHDDGQSVAVQSDGKIIVAGYSWNGSKINFALVRYTASGTLDTGFGNGGKVTTPIRTSFDVGQSVALQSDGKIVVGGYSSDGSNDDFALVRYTASGTLDAGFGTGGKVITSVGDSDDGGSSVAVQSDGKIVVAGYSLDGNNANFALVRYNANGTLDSSFGAGGKVTTAIGTGNDYGLGVTVQSDGKIVVAGHTESVSGCNCFALARYTSSGALDSSFGTGGKVTTDIGGFYDIGHSIALQSDGKIVVAGSAAIGSTYDFALARYTSTGALDTGFGSGGKVTTPIGSSTDYCYSVAVQSDGKIVTAGWSDNGGNWGFALARYTNTGAPDTSFGSGGKVITGIGNSSSYGQSVAVQGDGKIVVAGYSYNGSSDDFALVRYLGDSAIAPTITVQPQSRNVLAGQSTTFTVQVTANPAPTYQWRRFSMDIFGATAATLTLNNVQVDDAANYSVVVRNSAGVAYSANAQLGVLLNFVPIAPLYPAYPPLASVPPGADSLVFITHGRTRPGAQKWDDQVTWMNAMKDSIEGKVPGNWTVMTYEWEAESRKSPTSVLSYATKVGSFVGKELANLSASRPNGRWAHVHFIVHSAGSALIEEASRLVKAQNTPPDIHSTFLDPFTGVQDGGRQEYGKVSDWSDNYFSFSPDTWDGVFGRTLGPMLKSHDVEVSWLDPNKTLAPLYCASQNGSQSTPGTPCSYFAKSTHGWPITFYQKTIDFTPAQLPSDYVGYGFPLSKEGGGWANRSSYPAGSAAEVQVLGAPSGVPAVQRSVTTGLDIDFANSPNAIGQTGQVQFTVGGVSLFTQSAAPSPSANAAVGPSQSAAAPPPPIGNPAWISILPNVTSSVNFITFNAEFTGAAGSMGLLTVYWNDEEIGQIDERTISPGVHSYTFEISNAFLDRSNTLGFRLDQFSAVTSGISVSNVKTGFGGLPTPARLKIESMPGISTPVLTVTGTQDFTYLIETSPDLVNWEPMAAVTLDTGVNAALTDPEATGLQLRFYRVVSP